MNFKYFKPILWVLLLLLPVLSFGQRRASIAKQLQKSITNYSLIVTDVNDEQGYMIPGSEGHILTIVGGIPTWSSGSGADTNYAENDLTADANRSHVWTTFNQTETFTTGDYTLANTGAVDALVVDGATAAIKIGDYGAGANTGTATYLLGVDVDGNIIEETLAAANTNYAENDLTADANRAHTWTTFNQTETFTSGDFKIANTGSTGAFFIDGATARIGMKTINPQSLLSVSGNMAIGSSYAGIFAASTDGLIVEGNTGMGITIATEQLHVDGNIRYSGALKPNNSVGTSGYLLTSAGGGVNTWTDPATVGEGDTNYAEDDLVADANRNHLWTIYGLTQTFTNGDFTIGNTGAVDALLVDGATGAVKIGDYGAGVNTGTPTYNLEVDVDGNIIESTSGGGGGTLADNGLNLNGVTVELGGTLNKATAIAGNGFNLTYTGVNTYSFTAASSVDILSESFGDIAGFTSQFASESKLYAENAAGTNIFNIIASSSNSGILFDGQLASVPYQYKFPAYNGTANQILQNDGAGSVEWVDPSSLGLNTNYAEDDLTADANRSHTWTTFNQVETFTTGDFTIANTGDATAFFIDGATGEVGLGTATTDTKLHVQSADNTLAHFESTDAIADIKLSDLNTTADVVLQRITNNTYINPQGGLIAAGGVSTPVATLHLRSDAIAQPGLIVEGETGQTADIFSVKNFNSVADYFGVEADGQISLDEYGAGTFTGTSTYLLAVDVNGDLIEEAFPIVTIYTGDGTLTSDRIMTLSTFDFQIEDGTHDFYMDNDGQGTRLSYDSGAGKTSNVQVNTIGTLSFNSDDGDDSFSQTMTQFNTVFTGTDTPNGKICIVEINSDRMEVKSQISFSGDISPAALVATPTETNDYAPTGITSASFINLTCNASGSILTGISATDIVEGTRIDICVDTGQLTINHEDTSSTAANRFDLSQDANATFRDGECFTIRYNDIIDRWQIL